MNAARWGGTHGWRAYVPHTLDSKHESLKRILTGLNLIICFNFWGKFGGGTAAGLHFCFCFPLIVSYKASVERSIAAASYGCSCLLLAEYRNETVWSCPFRFQAHSSMPRQNPHRIFPSPPVRELLLAGIMYVFIMGAKSKDTYNQPLWILSINSSSLIDYIVLAGQLVLVRIISLKLDGLPLTN